MASLALGSLSQVHEAAAQPDLALSLAWRAVARAQLAEADDALYRGYAQTARLLAAKGETDDAIDSYQRALLGAQDLQRRVRRSGAARDSELNAERNQNLPKIIIF